jgi:NAD+ synthase (glutamine-hydrolysing)
VGSHHCNLEIDLITDAVVSVFSRFVSDGRKPEFMSRGGSLGEDLALQNIQVSV